MADTDQSGQTTSLSFAAFVLSLAHTAAVHFGDVPDPVSGGTGRRNLPAAQQMIDILTLLELKTRGNLTADERQLLEQILYELRLRFVEARNTGEGSQSAGDTDSHESRHVPPSGSRTPSGIIIP